VRKREERDEFAEFLEPVKGAIDAQTERLAQIAETQRSFFRWRVASATTTTPIYSALTALGGLATILAGGPPTTLSAWAAELALRGAAAAVVLTPTWGISRFKVTAKRAELERLGTEVGRRAAQALAPEFSELFLSVDGHSFNVDQRTDRSFVAGGLEQTIQLQKEISDATHARMQMRIIDTEQRACDAALWILTPMSAPLVRILGRRTARLEAHEKEKLAKIREGAEYAEASLDDLADYMLDETSREELGFVGEDAKHVAEMLRSAAELSDARAESQRQRSSIRRVRAVGDITASLALTAWGRAFGASFWQTAAAASINANKPVARIPYDGHEEKVEVVNRRIEHVAKMTQRLGRERQYETPTENPIELFSARAARLQLPDATITRPLTYAVSDSPGNFTTLLSDNRTLTNTLMRNLARGNRMDDGEMELAGVDVRIIDPAWRREKLVYCPPSLQTRVLRRIVQLNRIDEATLTALFERWNLPPSAARELSVPQSDDNTPLQDPRQQKLATLCLSTRGRPAPPHLLFLEHPFDGLSPEDAECVHDELESLQSHGTRILVADETHQTQRHANSLIAIQQGFRIISGPVLGKAMPSDILSPLFWPLTQSRYPLVREFVQKMPDAALVRLHREYKRTYDKWEAFPEGLPWRSLADMTFRGHHRVDVSAIKPPYATNLIPPGLDRRLQEAGFELADPAREALSVLSALHTRDCRLRGTPVGDVPDYPVATLDFEELFLRPALSRANSVSRHL
jgi:hypothetical protein